MPEPDSTVVKLACKTADEFLDKLSPRNAVFRRTLERRTDWMFRGHADINFKLLPSARRSEVRLAEKWLATQGATLNGPVLRDQFLAEYFLLDNFYRTCDRVGIELPDGCHDIRRDDPLDFQIYEWPPPSWWPLAATAQHHGIPTCFLDFTRRSFVAAFFAAADPDFADKREGHLAVWAIDASSLGLLRPPTLPLSETERFDLPVVPHVGNHRLRAQSGMFIVHRMASASHDERQVKLFEPLKHFEPWDKILERLYPRVRPLAYRFSLPRTEVPQLLDLLRCESITRSTLFPDMTGVAQHVQEAMGLKPGYRTAPALW